MARSAYASRGTQTGPGDLLDSRTCQDGCLAELWGRHGYHVRPSLQAGHDVTATVEGLGGTRNGVVADTLTLGDGRFGDAAAEFVQVPDGDSDHL